VILVLIGFAALVLAVGGPLWLIMGRIHRRAESARVSPVGALFLAFVGYLFGTVAANFGAFSLISLYSGRNLSSLLIFPTLLVGSCAGSIVGSGVGYIFIWARTTHDPDFEPLDRSLLSRRSTRRES